MFFKLLEDVEHLLANLFHLIDGRPGSLVFKSDGSAAFKMISELLRGFDFPQSVGGSFIQLSIAPSQESLDSEFVYRLLHPTVTGKPLGKHPLAK